LNFHQSKTERGDEWIYTQIAQCLRVVYRIACPAKYRKVAVNEKIDKTIKGACEEASERHEINFLK
jgi:hypothetical protein